LQGHTALEMAGKVVSKHTQPNCDHKAHKTAQQQMRLQTQQHKHTHTPTVAHIHTYIWTSHSVISHSENGTNYTVIQLYAA